MQEGSRLHIEENGEIREELQALKNEIKFLKGRIKALEDFIKEDMKSLRDEIRTIKNIAISGEVRSIKEKIKLDDGGSPV